MKASVLDNIVVKDENSHVQEKEYTISPAIIPTNKAITDWWNNVLKCPKHIVAPMVDASELPWRLLSRRYNTHLCFTPMVHSKNFVKDIKYRMEVLNSCQELNDRPLIIQFCGNDSDVLTEAATFAKDYCDGVDINLGCPQKIAKTGRYGSYLQDEWNLISSIVTSINEKVGIPVSCKIRIFQDKEKTVRYAKMIEAAGSWMLTVHGRTREQKGPLTGLADWSYIKAVREAVSIPVVANGNIQYLQDVQRCIDATGVNAVMSAEGNLHNPALFSGMNPPTWELALEYLDLVKIYRCPVSYMRGHLFKIFRHLLSLEENFDLRDVLAAGRSLEQFEEVVFQLRDRYKEYHAGLKQWMPPLDNPVIAGLPYPVWICQPYERPTRRHVDVGLGPVPQKSGNLESVEGEGGELDVVVPLSKKSLKRLKRKAAAVASNPRMRDNANLIPCLNPVCHNFCGIRCALRMCKTCCIGKCKEEMLDCESHRATFASKRNKQVAQEPNVPV